MKFYIDKVKNTYKNHGAKVVIAKTGNFFKIKFIEKMHPSLVYRKHRSSLEEYSFVSNPIFQITEEDMQRSANLIRESELRGVKTATWFVPNFDHIKFGGIFTIFRFIEKFSMEGVINRIVIYDNPSFDIDALHVQIADNFPGLKNYEIIIFDHSREDVNDIPESDIAICSFWVSAYLLLKFNKTKRKYYFIQDYEPLFYPGGSTYALAESTYRFGLQGLVNTPGLLAAINQRHGMEGVSFTPAVDKSIYYPDLDKNNERTKIFFYARPNNPRNAFALGVEIIKRLIDEHGDSIEIITAGAEWNEGVFGLHNKITNLGLIGSLEEVAAVYRQCDIGFVYMLSKHPSYQPFEFMASGVATVTNNNEDNLWMLKDGENCLVSEPAPAAMAQKISSLVGDKKLRDHIIANGQKTVDGSWDRQLDSVWNYIHKT